MLIYYAHCVALYNTPQETRDIDLLETLFEFATIVNPNSSDTQAQCEHIRAEVTQFNQTRISVPRDAGAEIMVRIFQPLVASCNALAFRALPDGRIPSGVYKEILWAQERNLPVIELPSNLLNRDLSAQATKAYLMEVGQR